MNLKSKLPPQFQKYASFGVIPKLLLTPVALIIILTIIVLRPLVKVLIYKLDWPFGHFFVMPHLATHFQSLSNSVSRKKKIGVFCITDKSVSNQYVLKKFRQNIPIIKGHLGWLLVEISNKITCITVSEQTSVIDFCGRNLAGPHSSRNKRDLLIQFSQSEKTVGQQFMQKNNRSGNQGSICLNIRDSLYNDSVSRIKKSYDARNSQTSTYVAMAEKAAEMGYTVYRMGAIVKEPLVSSHPRVIDYATNGMRTEFLDIFLGANCTFAVSVGSGWDCVPIIFRRPTIFVNHVPIFSGSAVTLPLLIYPKILCDRANDSELSLLEMLNRNIANRFNTQAYIDAGVVIRDLSSEELVEAVTEMAQRVEGTFVETPEQKEMQAKLKHILSTHPKLQPSPNYYPIRAQFASCFLSRYPNFLDGLD